MAPPPNLSIALPTSNSNIPDPSTIRPPASNPNVLLTTSLGNITVELYWQHSPITALNFHTLAARHYYDRCTFHRIVRQFVLQGGDPTATGRGGDSAWHRPFPDELHNGLLHVGAGVLSMANSGANTNGSQFFITLAPTQHLDGRHTVFGRVSGGMDVVRRMGLVAVGANDKPVDPVVIYTARPCD